MPWKNKLKNKLKKNYSSFPQVSKDTIIYAIGDIHGCADLLAKMHQKIQEDSVNS